jgi:hypothetical protein
VDAHEFAAVFVALQRKFGAGKRINQRFPRKKRIGMRNSIPNSLKGLECYFFLL